MTRSSNNNKNVQGSWRGYYTYSSVPSRQFGFEAVLLQGAAGAVEGNILDSGRLGEARVFGSFGYPSLKFTKVYDNKAKAPVHYNGAMSEDGNTLSGTWLITSRSNGSWVMSRLDDHEFDFDVDTDEESLEEEREKVAVLPASGGGKR